ncbi:replication factor C subunit 5 isoform X1 [Oryzias latipes]|uniref:replication factor C subunit 5 isoform X1 n=1 Tax=Oryzias latipes TaxID=8090 RepID=UPI000CE25D17|nr:replication factor C subunit 5 isoform X1 [Oryzias latipes]
MASTSRTPLQSRNLPWVEKYRPQKLDDLISHRDILSTIQRFVREDRLPHLLLYGPPGTGKTSTILACARQLYKDKEFNSMVLELNASDDRGIDVVRGPILSFASTRTIFKKGFKLVILDEADAMTQDAQNALRRVIEKFTENTRFCLICNYLSKIIPALQSRCTRFRFGPLSADQMIPRLRHVIQEESIDITEDGMKAIVTLSSGDMRRSLNVLQSTSMAYGKVTEDSVYTCTGQPLRSDIANILDWCLNKDFTSAYKQILQLKTLKGLALHDILTELHLLVHRGNPAEILPLPSWREDFFFLSSSQFHVLVLHPKASISSETFSSSSAEVDFPPATRMTLLVKLADVEHRLASGTDEKIQLSSMVGAFQEVRDLVVSEAS